jgi:hypothetical protein
MNATISCPFRAGYNRPGRTTTPISGVESPKALAHNMIQRHDRSEMPAMRKPLTWGYAITGKALAAKPAQRGRLELLYAVQQAHDTGGVVFPYETYTYLHVSPL